MNESELVDKIKNKLPTGIVIASVFSLAIGQFNDTIDVANKVYGYVLSTFTDISSNEKLDKIYINASSELLKETFGPAIYIKRSTGDLHIKYYRDKNYLLSAIIENKGIAAFLIFPINGYIPSMHLHAASKGYQSKAFDLYPETLNNYSNIANIGSYYIEEIQGGQFHLLYKSISGSSNYIGKYSDLDYKVLTKFNDTSMMEEDTTLSLQKVRETLKPNFYGYSKIELLQLSQAILSASEFKMLVLKPYTHW